MGYTFDALKTYVPEMVELFIDCARNSIFLDWIGRSMNRKIILLQGLYLQLLSQNLCTPDVIIVVKLIQGIRAHILLLHLNFRWLA
ncbi:hypothetical protein LWI28_020730 [Acer negundo]|uniref:Uncharacterized protein n=1 Tax=Acer negundo TaxID=4023 RepID=A0AAD5JCA4_ACENE|nr:hypothetical protein LWI28_020730 [Acer negundo]